MIEIYLLEQLIAVNQYKSFNTAAKKLNLTQPTITRSMQKIEQEFGVPIFTRKSNKVELNEAGKVAVKYAKRILKEKKKCFKTYYLRLLCPLVSVRRGHLTSLKKHSHLNNFSNTTQFF